MKGFKSNSLPKKNFLGKNRPDVIEARYISTFAYILPSATILSTLFLCVDGLGSDSGSNQHLGRSILPAVTSSIILILQIF